MTIISHTNQFIYIKARKVASSSLLVAFGKHCRAPDIVTSPGDTEGHERIVLNCKDVDTHTPPSVIKEMVTAEQWENYTKITSVRNPWDVAVSMLFWRIHLQEIKPRRGLHLSEALKLSILNHDIDLANTDFRKPFKEIIISLKRNESFYFDPDGKPYADIYLRYENLQAEFDQACRKLSLPLSTLPSLKTAARRKEHPYAAFYDNELRELVYEVNRNTIDFFGYTF